MHTRSCEVRAPPTKFLLAGAPDASIVVAIGVATCFGRLAVAASGRRRNVARPFASGLRFGSARVFCAAKLFGASFFANAVLAHAPKGV